jgi:hypothetical protein
MVYIIAFVKSTEIKAHLYCFGYGTTTTGLAGFSITVLATLPKDLTQSVETLRPRYYHSHVFSFGDFDNIGRGIDGRNEGAQIYP